MNKHGQGNRHTRSRRREGKDTLDAFVKRALELGADKAKVIDTDTIVVEEWVRWKCMYGCIFYDKDAYHAPFAPDAESTRKAIKGYTKGILLNGSVAKTVTEAALRIEGEAYQQGYYKAFAFAALPLGPGAG